MRGRPLAWTLLAAAVLAAAGCNREQKLAEQAAAGGGAAEDAAPWSRAGADQRGPTPICAKNSSSEIVATAAKKTPNRIGCER